MTVSVYDDDNDVLELNQLNTEIQQLIDIGTSVSQFGYNPTAAGVLQTTKLLSGTSLDALAIEALCYDNPDGPESTLALETLASAITDKITQWSSKIVRFAKQTIDRLSDLLDTSWNGIKTMATTLTTKTWSAAKSTGQTIKAHPIKTVLAVTGAALAAVGVITYMTGHIPGTSVDGAAIKAFMTEVADKCNAIKSPLGSIHAESVKEGTQLAFTFEEASVTAASASAKDLGYSQGGVRAVTGQLQKIWASVKSAMTTLGQRVVSVVKKVDEVGGDANKVIGEKVAQKTGSKLAGWFSAKTVERLYGTMFATVFAAVAKLIHYYVLKAFHLVKDNFKKLTPVTE